MAKRAAVTPDYLKVKLEQGNFTGKQFLMFAARQAVPAYHKIGTELLAMVKGSESKSDVLKNYAELAGSSGATLRKAMKLAQMYTAKQVKALGDKGFHMGHIEHLICLNSAKDRKALEAEIMKGKLTTKQTKAFLDRMAEEDENILSPSAQKRRRERQTSKRKELTDPVKSVPKCLSSLNSFKESCSNLKGSFENPGSVKDDKQARKEVLSKLKELKKAAELNQGLLKDLKKAVDKQINEIKNSKL